MATIITGTFPNSSSSISASQIQSVGATDGTTWGYSVSSWIGKTIYDGSGGIWIVPSSGADYNFFRGRYAGYTTSGGVCTGVGTCPTGGTGGFEVGTGGCTGGG